MLQLLSRIRCKAVLCLARVCMICDVVESLNVILVRARIPTVLLCIAALLNEPAMNENSGVRVIYVQHLGEPLLLSQYCSSS